MNIAIIGAMEKEISMLVKHYNAEKISSFHDIYKAVYNNHNIFISMSGIGKVNSAMNTQYIIDQFHPNFIINTGCAGSLTESVKIMDTILSKQVTYHDFHPKRIMQESTPDNGMINCDPTLLEETKEILEEFAMPFHVGTICSGDCFVTDTNTRDEIYYQTKALCVDMESGSIAHVARKNNVPFITIRTISDFSDGIEEKELEAAIKSSNVVIKLIERLYEKNI